MKIGTAGSIVLTEEQKQELAELGHALFACPELGFKGSEIKRDSHFFFNQRRIFGGNRLKCDGTEGGAGNRGRLSYRPGSGYGRPGSQDSGSALCISLLRPQHSDSCYGLCHEAFKGAGIAEKSGGRVSFIAAPAEEFIDFDSRRAMQQEGKIQYFSGKQDMIANGVFDDVDCVISMHVNGDSGELMFDVQSSLAGFAVKKAVFHGRASHSGAAPHLGAERASRRQSGYECHCLYEGSVFG